MRNLPYWMDVQADPSLCWSHRSYCRFYCALAYLVYQEQVRLSKHQGPVVQSIVSLSTVLGPSAHLFIAQSKEQLHRSTP